MAQRFTSLDEAAQQLNISKDRLNDLREAGKVRAYRDGASWKFRSEDIERLISDGVDSAEPSDIDLSGPEPGEETLPAGYSGELNLDDAIDLNSEDLKLGEIDLDGEPAAKGAEVSDPDLTNVDEPTTPLGPEGATGDELELVVEPLEEGDDAESILLSDADFTDPHGRPPSTIIGKVELDREVDLELAPGSSARQTGKSDVRLHEPADDVLGSDILGSGVLDTGTSASAKFEDLAELEIDLEAESSRILAPGDVKAAQSAAQQQQQAKPGSDLMLDDDFDLAGSGAGISSIDVTAAKPARGPSASSASPLEMASADDDDFVLGGEGSDITLSSADSGINLRPSDSGLALDEVAMSLGGSGVGSALDLGQPRAAGRSGSLAGLSDLGEVEDFQLTPLSEAPADEDEEDSSQIIALEEVAEEPAEELLGPSRFTDVGLGADTMLAPTGVSVAAADTQFTGANVTFLSLCFLLLMLCGMMMIDLMRNMWSWNETFDANSGLIDGILGLLGLGS
jgi:excisionase family DNA binding protein